MSLPQLLYSNISKSTVPKRRHLGEVSPESERASGPQDSKRKRKDHPFGHTKSSRKVDNEK